MLKVQVFVGHYRPHKMSFHRMLFYFELLIFVKYLQLWPNNYAIFSYLYFLPDLKSQQLLYVTWPFQCFIFFIQVNKKNI